jgi:hypothetical protein
MLAVVLRRLFAVGVAFVGVMVGLEMLNSPPAHPGTILVPLGILGIAGFLWKGWR